MQQELGLSDFQKNVEKIAAILIAEIPAKLSEKSGELKDQNWKSAYIDSRWTTDGSTSIAKLRVELSDGKWFSRIRIPKEADDLLDQIGDMKDKVFPDKWYGMTLTVIPSGKCKVKFDYNPDCSVDPHFFDPG
jgi:hypothetical protein